MNVQKQLVSIVAPFYNEGSGVEVFHVALDSVMARAPQFDFEVVCVDDGSRDDTLSRLVGLSKRDSRFRVVELTRNFGKEAALTAGLDSARGAAVIPFDADLQDPPEVILALLDEWQKGAEVVLAHRADRSTDSFLKRTTAAMFYRLHNRFSTVQLPDDVGDCRLMDRAVVDALGRLPERQRFMKGLFAWVGFHTVSVDYVRRPRAVGDSKFSGWKLWNLAIEGVTSFSTVPLRVWSYIGVCGALLTFLYAAFIVVRTLAYGTDVPGYASLLVAILFFGSLQLIGIGVLGEYLGRVYMEAKQRPTYLVRKYHGMSDES